MSRKIALSKQGWRYRGKFSALVDDEDFDKINSFAWSYCLLNKRSYAITTFPTTSNGPRQMLMHRMILGIDSSVDIDHIDGDGLNNTRGNLRICDRSDNLHNQGPRNGKKYKGLHEIRPGVFAVYICYDGKSHYVGTFYNLREAVVSYNEAAIVHHGEFARLNEI